MSKQEISVWNMTFLRRAALAAVVKLNPLTLIRNPVMLVVEIGSVVTTVAVIRNALAGQSLAFNLQISLWLWFTVMFANFAEALAEVQGRARAESLRKTRSRTVARCVLDTGRIKEVSSAELGKGDLVRVEENELIPGDGEIVEGAALVDESAITGESAPVVRDAGSDRSGVTGGTKVLSGTIVVRITVEQGESFIDGMIKMVEGAKRHKTPNEIALEVLLVALTVLFLVVVVTLPAFGRFMGVSVSVTVLVSLLVCLMPTTIGGLLPAIGIAGMSRLLQKNVLALSGRAIEASGDVDIVLLDKTGTITLGNRMASEFLPAPNVDRERLIRAAILSSLADETPEGRSILVLAKQELGIHGSDIRVPDDAIFVKFTPESRMSGIDLKDRAIRKGAFEAICDYITSRGGQVSDFVRKTVDDVARKGDTPLVVAENAQILGVVRLKDILKEGIRARLDGLRRMGIKSVMITGDNPLTAASIAAEAGVDDFIAQAKPETKLQSVRQYQLAGHLVAMIGDGTNDAPALAQADVAVAMNAGTQVAREASNMVDLDSSPTKLLDIVEIGKQILITRGALTTFSIANDVSKYFAIIPALFAAQFPAIGILNVMRLATPASAVLSAVIFNAVAIPALIPLALRGVKYRAKSITSLLTINLLIYGLGGLAIPFVGIKLIDLLVVFLRLA